MHDHPGNLLKIARQRHADDLRSAQRHRLVRRRDGNGADAVGTVARLLARIPRRQRVAEELPVQPVEAA